MFVWLFLLVVVCIIAINIFLWKSGFLMQAEHPKTLEDRPLKDPRVRTAIIKRVKRWREEGKLTRGEAERLEILCQTDWDSE